jgi:WD40 repeat protein
LECGDNRRFGTFFLLLPFGLLSLPSSHGPVRVPAVGGSSRGVIRVAKRQFAVQSVAMLSTRFKMVLGLVAALVTAGAATFALQEELRPAEHEGQPIAGKRPSTDATKPASQPRADRLGDPLPAGALLRLGTMRHRYLNHWPFQTEYLPGGKTALTDTFEEVRWVDVESGRLLKSWPLPKGLAVTAFSRDGRVVLLTDENAVFLWDLTSRKPLWWLAEPEGLPFKEKRDALSRISAVFAPDSKVVAVKYAAASGLRRMVDVASGRELWRHERQDLRDLGFLRDGKSLLLQQSDAKVTRIFQCDRRTCDVMRSFEIAGEIGSCQLPPDSTILLGTTADKGIRTFDVATGKELASLMFPPVELPHQIRIAVSRDAKTVLTGATFEGLVRIWDWPSAKQRGKIDLGAGASPFHLRVSDDGKRAEIVESEEQALRSFDLETGREIATLKEAHRSPVYGLAIAPDGKAVTAGTDRTIRVWDLRSGRQVHEHQTGPLSGLMAYGPMLAMSADGRLVAVVKRFSGKVLIYERDKGRLLHSIDTGAKRILSVAFAPATHLLAITTVEGWFLILWDVDLGREKWRGTRARLEPAFSPDGRLLAVRGESGSERVYLLDAATGRQRLSIPSKHHTCMLTFSPDGRMLAGSGLMDVVVWETATGKERWRRKHDTDDLYYSGALAFAPDNRRLAYGHYRFVQLEDLLDGQRLHSFAGHDPGINALAFGPGGRTLVSAGWDTTVLVWDMSPWSKSQRSAAAAPPPGVLQTAWNDLASADAKVSFAAVSRLVQAGPAALPLLREHLGPVQGPDPKHVERLLAELGSDRFANRERAKNELELADLAEPVFERFLTRELSLEARRRAEAILARLQGPVTDANRLRQLRALEVLEHIGSPAARQVIDTLAAGAVNARLTQEARMALQRLARRDAEGQKD